MKTLVIDIIDPADGDLVIIMYEAARGGRTHVMHRVVGEHQGVRASEDGRVTELFDVPAQTPKDIAEIFAGLINAQWPKEGFNARLKDGSLVVFCQDMVSDVTFSAEVEGGGGTKVSLKEF